MRLAWDPFIEEFRVGDQTLREFYMAARKEAGITIAKLESDSGLSRGVLRGIEKVASHNVKLGKSSRAMLIALETLGCTLDIS